MHRLVDSLAGALFAIGVSLVFLGASTMPSVATARSGEEPEPFCEDSSFDCEATCYGQCLFDCTCIEESNGFCGCAESPYSVAAARRAALTGVR